MKTIIGVSAYIMALLFAVEAYNKTAPAAFALGAVFLAISLVCAFKQRDE